MTTTLFAIFGIALVATLAWVIIRIVNIFVELEELHQRTKDHTERIDNHCSKVNKMKEDVDHIKQTQTLTAEHLGVIDEEIKALDQRCDALQICSEVVNEFDIVKLTSREVKEVRLTKYTELRANGLSIRNAGEEVGVSYQTARRYEKQRKAQSNETRDN
jgi:predicted nuclease with TOPRIM domain